MRLPEATGRYAFMAVTTAFMAWHNIAAVPRWRTRYRPNRMWVGDTATLSSVHGPRHPPMYTLERGWPLAYYVEGIAVPEGDGRRGWIGAGEVPSGVFPYYPAWLAVVGNIAIWLLALGLIFVLTAPRPTRTTAG